jgi:hypothetical protein
LSTDGGTTARPVTPRRVVKAVPVHETTPSPREIGDRARLAGEVTASLERVRTTAENWRTGMAGIITLVTATLLFKGRESISDYEAWVRYALGALTLCALALALVSLWLFLSAAYGRLRPVSAQSVIDAGGVDVRNVHLATSALADLRWARGLAICSSVVLAAALVLSWYGPAEPSAPPAYVRITIRGDDQRQSEETLCGELTAQDGGTTVVAIEGEPEPRRVDTGRLLATVLVDTC